MFIGNSHANGGIPSEIAESGTKIEIEGNEYYICNEAYNSPNHFDFKKKTNKEILDFIYTEFACKLNQDIMHSGDFIVCKVVVADNRKKDRKGTIKQILNEMQGEKNCKVESSSNYLKQGGLIAPNGKKSNLTPEQYKLVRTPAFKKWFGDWEKDPANASKIVDENGEPLVVYHGGNDDFNIFNLNKTTLSRFYFTPDKKYAEFRGVFKAYFLKVINLEYEEWQDRKNLPKPKGEFSGFGNLLKLYGKKPIMNLAEIVVFDSNQIKLADGTNTTFDNDNSDIRYKEGGNIDYFNWDSLYNTSDEETERINEEIRLSEEQEKEDKYQRSSFSKKWAANRSIAIDKLVKQYLDAKKTYDDWASRQYKENKTNVFLSGDDIFGESKSIGSINEGRKRKVLKGSKMLMDESVSDLKEIGLKDYEIDALINKTNNDSETLFNNGGMINFVDSNYYESGTLFNQ